jgi:hypothetical protein
MTLVPALARADWEEGDDVRPPTPFALVGRSPGGTSPAPAAPAYLTASRIAALGDGALAIDADTGILFATRADGSARRAFMIGGDAGLLAVDPVAQRVYVADRRGDRIAVLAAGEVTPVAQWRTPAEPFAVALTPDRTRVLVTTIADRTLVAYAPSGREQWRAPLASEPRGLAISPDGKRALVTYLAAGFADEIALAAPHAVTHRALPVESTEHARAAFAVTYLGDHLAVVAFQREQPQPLGSRFPEDEGRYGGSRLSPIDDAFALLGERGAQTAAITQVAEPRALAWNGARDELYLAGLASRVIVRVDRASQVDAVGTAVPIGAGCGADGLAVDRAGKLLVWCSFTRSVMVLGGVRGPSLIPSTLDAQQHAGFVAFHSESSDISTLRGIACGSCHLDGRADGMSWRIHGEDLQTPMLAGRLVGTAPFKWDGGAKDLRTSIAATVKRLDGVGLGKAQLAELVAYLEHLPAVRTPTRDARQIARGETQFESLGCAGCHDGAVLTDRRLHRFGGPADKSIDTPSLIGLAASAPYLHDGSAATLESLLRERGTVHGMADTSRTLADHEIADLVAYLETR